MRWVIFPTELNYQSFLRLKHQYNWRVFNQHLCATSEHLPGAFCCHPELMYTILCACHVASYPHGPEPKSISRWILSGFWQELLMFVSYPVTLLETNIHKSPNAHYLYIVVFLDFSAYFFGGISTRRLHFYLLLINNCRKMKKKNCLISSLWLPLFPPFRCWRGWDCQHCDHWRHGKLHNLRAEAEFLDSVHYCL